MAIEVMATILRDKPTLGLSLARADPMRHTLQHAPYAQTLLPWFRTDLRQAPR